MSKIPSMQYATSSVRVVTRREAHDILWAMLALRRLAP